MVEQATVVAAIVAIVEAIKSKFPDVQGIYTVIIAGLLGTAAGFLGVASLTPVMGLVAGLGAVGVHTVASTAGSSK